MSARLKKCFSSLRHHKRSAFVPFITAGDPDFETSYKILSSLPLAGADIIELGMPFSDPIADGPIIQNSSLRALRNKMNIASIFRMIKGFRQDFTDFPIILMGYFNPLYVYGCKDFAKDAYLAGVDGIIIVDLPAEEEQELKVELDKYDIDLIRLISPTSDFKRLQQILQNTKGFIYYISIAGVTGAKGSAIKDISVHVDIIRKYSDLPILVGFGISTAKQVSSISKIADGIVIGSSIIKVIEENIRHKNMIDEVVNYVSRLAYAMNAKDGLG